MAKTNLNQILTQLETLDLDELRQVKKVIIRREEEIEKLTQQTKFHQALLNSGLVKQIKQNAFAQQTERRFIQVHGKPVSETIIEERR
ncbi:hypothetical protein ACE1CI_01330 [Aerosakkonemataceae cyanobacterium BLCC-F50]|uniref:Uncharacterized protein n=1 Tax=Floridaenema flaviceps BLCC-F50 TaxID=3153642 RepID=A0ABV4XIL7_9CYAN